MNTPLKEPRHSESYLRANISFLDSVTDSDRQKPYSVEWYIPVNLWSPIPLLPPPSPHPHPKPPIWASAAKRFLYVLATILGHYMPERSGRGECSTPIGSGPTRSLLGQQAWCLPHYPWPLRCTQIEMWELPNFPADRSTTLLQWMRLKTTIAAALSSEVRGGDPNKNMRAQWSSHRGLILEQRLVPWERCSKILTWGRQHWSLTTRIYHLGKENACSGGVQQALASRKWRSGVPSSCRAVASSVLVGELFSVAKVALDAFHFFYQIFFFNHTVPYSFSSLPGRLGFKPWKLSAIQYYGERSGLMCDQE